LNLPANPPATPICADLLDEYRELDALCAGLDPAQWRLRSAFHGWSAWDEVAHLCYFDEAALLALADARRDSSADAAARMTSLRTRIEQYLTQYQALVEAGRGGEGAAEGLASTAAALGAVVASYDQGIAASQQAAAAAEEARSYGQRIMFSAASVALANAAALALESSGLHDQIVNQVDQMHQDLVTGQTNFDNAFGGQGGGGQGGGGG